MIIIKNVENISFSEFITETKENKKLEVNIDARWLRRGVIVLIVIGGFFLFPGKVS
ncbi:hypothetical protein WKH57_25640 [Niallia taxi]|uniref:hypothetical protein n=1 Tax=Niallia taxi TaxID=2499688 RepID=UPI0031714ECD